MQGMSTTTGQHLDGVQHLYQSIADILTTPIGTRVQRRDYGSRIFELIDAPANRQTIIAIYAEAADALRKWEPRLQLERVQATAIQPGQVTLTITGWHTLTGERVQIEGLIIK